MGSLRRQVVTAKQEAQWVLRAQCNDRDALELLLQAVQPSLRRYLHGLVGALYADDVLQEVLIILACKLSWLAKPDLFRPWAFRIASRAGFRHLKKHRRLREQALDESGLEELAAPITCPPDALLQTLHTMEGFHQQVVRSSCCIFKKRCRCRKSPLFSKFLSAPQSPAWHMG